MFQDLMAGARDAEKCPEWVRKNPRYLRLYLLNLWLDGEFYDHIRHPFVQEKTSTNTYIPISKRRPHFVFNVPRQVALKVARKLFAGRQKPGLVSENAELLTAAASLLEEGFFDTEMLDAAVKASIGAVCMSFDFKKDGAGVLRIVFETHRSRDCFPEFDGLGELRKLTITSICFGQDFFESGYTHDYKGEPLKAGDRYWCVRVLDLDSNRWFKPIPFEEYDPTKVEDRKKLKEDEDRTTLHNLKFVFAHWMVNKTGAKSKVDGCCAWETALSSCIVLDMTLSQLFRGVWYSVAPTPVFKGKLINQTEGEDGNTVVAGPANAVQFAAGTRDPAGNSIDGGDAHLLETNGAGMKEGREACELGRKYILEQIQSSRKDPDRMRTSAMSGSAMEQMDEDSIDLIQDMRTAIGDQGGLVVTKKALMAAVALKHPLLTNAKIADIVKLTYQWASTYNLSSHELLETVQALVLAVGSKSTETQEEGSEEGEGEGSDKGSGKSSSTSGSPGAGSSSTSSSSSAASSAASTESETGPELLTEDEARQILTGLLNLPRLATSAVANTQQQIPTSEDD